MDNKYNSSKIYKIEPICDYEEGDIYIGSTTKNYLCERMTEHRKSYRSWKKGVSKKTTVFDLFDKYGLEHCKIILVENLNVESRDQLKQREAHFIKSMKCVNKMTPNQTAKEYYIVNKEYIDKRNKEYYEAHKEQLNMYYKQYREENKEHKKEIDKAYREANKEKIKEKKHNPFYVNVVVLFKYKKRQDIEKHKNILI
jgi:hypothetical protein